MKRTSLDGYSDVAKKMHASRCRVNTDYRASPGREGKKGRNGRAGLTGKDKMSILRNGERIEIFQ